MLCTRVQLRSRQVRLTADDDGRLHETVRKELRTHGSLFDTEPLPPTIT